MKVKELIKWLKNKNPEDFVGLRDYGVGSGDWDDLQKKYDNRSNSLSNLEVLNFKQVIKEIKQSCSGKFAKVKLEEFHKRYGNDKQ